MTALTPHASIISLVSYQRPQEDNQKSRETWDQVVERVIHHQRWLWERSLARPLNEKENLELDQLKTLILQRKVLPDGRTLWLSGTFLSKKRESCMFNSAFTNIETVYDVVDLFWLLLQGCSVGFHPVPGQLNGFRCPLESIEVIRSCRTDADGAKVNQETYDKDSRAWTLKVGDSAEAFAKTVGKLLAGKFPAKKLILDFSEIRPAGSLLKGYGWRSCGDKDLASALHHIAKILSNRADQLLSRMDILEIIHQLGEVPVSKGVRELALFKHEESEWEELAAGKDHWKDKKNPADTCLAFQAKPEKEVLQKLFHLILESGGNKPCLINAKSAYQRAPWFQGCNPSKEILLGNKSVCTFVEVNLLAFQRDKAGLEKALTLAARMNYRQTLMNLSDEILQEAWHLNNQFLHLCGVSLSATRSRGDLNAYDFKRMRNLTVSAAFTMAEELNMPLPKNVTCIKPSRNLTRIMGTKQWGDVPGGAESPLGKYLFHFETFSKDDPLLPHLKKEGYHILDKPHEPEYVLVKLPASYINMPFSRARTTRKNGKIEELEINTDSAVEQLNWYAMLQNTWSEQNVSCTIFYDPSEIPEIIDWLLEHWETYVGAAFAFRSDPLKNAEDLGLPYLEQEVVTEDAYRHYITKLNSLAKLAEPG